MVFDSISWAWRFHKYSWHAIAPRIWVFKGKLSLEYIVYRRKLSTDVLEVLLSANSTPDKHRQNTKNNICIRHTRKIVVGFLLFLLNCIVEDLSIWTIHSIHLPNFDLGGNIPTLLRKTPEGPPCLAITCIAFYQYLVYFCSCWRLFCCNQTQIIMRKNLMKKNRKSYILLKRPKMLFLGEQKWATKKAPPSNSPDLFGGGGLS